MNQLTEIVRDEDEGLTEGSAGKLIGVKNHTMRKWRQQRTGPDYYGISARCVRYRRADVLRWLESRRVEPDDDGECRARRPAKRDDSMCEVRDGR